MTLFLARAPTIREGEERPVCAQMPRRRGAVHACLEMEVRLSNAPHTTRGRLVDYMYVLIGCRDPKKCNKKASHGACPALLFWNLILYCVDPPKSARIKCMNCGLKSDRQCTRVHTRAVSHSEAPRGYWTGLVIWKSAPKCERGRKERGCV